MRNLLVDLYEKRGFGSSAEISRAFDDNIARKNRSLKELSQEWLPYLRWGGRWWLAETIRRFEETPHSPQEASHRSHIGRRELWIHSLGQYLHRRMVS